MVGLNSDISDTLTSGEWRSLICDDRSLPDVLQDSNLPEWWRINILFESAEKMSSEGRGFSVSGYKDAFTRIYENPTVSRANVTGKRLTNTIAYLNECLVNGRGEEWSQPNHKGMADFWNKGSFETYVPRFD